jgi:hypothetical protein
LKREKTVRKKEKRESAMIDRGKERLKQMRQKEKMQAVRSRS